MFARGLAVSSYARDVMFMIIYESNFTFNTMLNGHTLCATALWGALERADGRELNKE